MIDYSRHESLKFDRPAEHVLRICINRPERLNALTTAPRCERSRRKERYASCVSTHALNHPCAPARASRCSDLQISLRKIPSRSSFRRERRESRNAVAPQSPASDLLIFL